MRLLILLLFSSLGIPSLSAQLSPIVQFSQTQRDALRHDQTTASAVRSLIVYVKDLNAAYDSVWKLPEDRMIALLEAAGPEQTEQRITLHAVAATGANALLEAMGIPDIRASVHPPRTFTWSGGSVVLDPLE